MINKKGFLDLKDIKGIPVIIDSIPETTEEYKNTVPMIPKFIVIHNTGNRSKTATDTANNNFMKNDDYMLWHFTVDEDSITQGHSVFRSGFHAGDGRNGKGNKTGIGIEIAENGDVTKAVENAFLLMMELEKQFPDLIIKPHQFFSGKHCPMWILDHWGWVGFIERYETMKKYFNVVSPEHWATKPYRSLINKGIVIHEQRFDDPITRGEMFALLDRVVK